MLWPCSGSKAMEFIAKSSCDVAKCIAICSKTGQDMEGPANAFGLQRRACMQLLCNDLDTDDTPSYVKKTSMMTTMMIETNYRMMYLVR